MFIDVSQIYYENDLLNIFDQNVESGLDRKTALIEFRIVKGKLYIFFKL